MSKPTQMTRISFFFILVILSGCKNINPLAKKLKDSALMLAIYHPGHMHRAIYLLNKATAIDSNYTDAYDAKLTFQLNEREFHDALPTAKRLSVLKHDDDNPFPKALLGGLYQVNGDSITGKKYLLKSIEMYEEQLKTADEKANYFTGLEQN